MREGHDSLGLDRRSFLGVTGLGATSFALGSGRYVDKTASRPRFRSNPFSLGVASGDPLPDGVVLWTRLAPDPLQGGPMPDRKVPVQWEIAHDEAFRRVVRRGTEFARPEFAHSVHVEVEGLQPGRWYYYRFKAGSEISPAGRTKTMPSYGASLDHLAFAVVSCQSWPGGYYTPYRHLAAEDLDLVVHTGDYIYEYGIPADGGRRKGLKEPVPEQFRSETVSLERYRLQYSLYKSEQELQAAHSMFPFVVTWDDHEVENNYADEFSQEDSEADQDPQVFLERRAAAYQAYYEHLPLRSSSMPRGPDLRLYRRLPVGDLLEFNVLDTRQYRSKQACGNGIHAECPERFDPSRSIIGDKQRRWLLEGLSRSQARWNVLAQQIIFCQNDLDLGDDQAFHMGGWDGYVPDRDAILDLVQEGKLRDLVVLTGDIHSNWANNIKADFNDPDSATLGAELISTSISSSGDGFDTSDRTEAQKKNNPHIEFLNYQRGYVRHMVSRGVWHADFRVVPYVSSPGAEITTRASFEIENGNPGLQKTGERRTPTQADESVEFSNPIEFRESVVGLR